MVVPIQVRNIIYSGSWRGSAESHVPHYWSYSLVQLIAISDHIVLGDLNVIPLAIWVILLVLAIVVMLRWGFGAWRRGDWSVPGKFLPLALAWIGIFALCYVAGIMAGSISSLEPDVMRYNLPVYPLLLAGLAGATSLFRFDALRMALAMARPRQCWVYKRLSFAAQLGPSATHDYGCRSPGADASPGQPLRSWLLDRVPRGRGHRGATEDRRCHYLLVQRPVDFHPGAAGSIGATFRLTVRHSSRACAASKASLYLLLFPAQCRLPQEFTSFPDGSCVRANTPGWLKLRIRTRDVAVFECETCAR